MSEPWQIDWMAGNSALSFTRCFPFLDEQPPRRVAELVWLSLKTDKVATTQPSAKVTGALRRRAHRQGGEQNASVSHDSKSKV